jgi:hypothetical protein
MTDVLEFSKFNMYAYDLQIYHSQPIGMFSEWSLEVNSDLRKIFEWSRANLLRLSPAKSMVLPIYIYWVLLRHFFMVSISSLMFIRLYVTLIWIGVIMFLLSVVRSLGSSLGLGTVRMWPIFVIVIPIFTYCDCVYFTLDSFSLRNLSVAFNLIWSYLRCFWLNFGILFADLHSVSLGILFLCMYTEFYQFQSVTEDKYIFF